MKWRPPRRWSADLLVLADFLGWVSLYLACCSWIGWWFS